MIRQGIISDGRTEAPADAGYENNGGLCDESDGGEERTALPEGMVGAPGQVDLRGRPAEGQPDRPYGGQPADDGAGDGTRDHEPAPAGDQRSQDHHVRCDAAGRRRLRLSFLFPEGPESGGDHPHALLLLRVHVLCPDGLRRGYRDSLVPAAAHRHVLFRWRPVRHHPLRLLFRPVCGGFLYPAGEQSPGVLYGILLHAVPADVCFPLRLYGRGDGAVSPDGAVRDRLYQPAERRGRPADRRG